MHRSFHDRTRRQVQDLSSGPFRVVLDLEVRRVRCRRCGSVKRERLQFLTDNPFYTQRFAYYVGWRCRSARIKDIAVEMRLKGRADAARLPILLTELRLPTIKRLWESISAQSDRESWRAARLLSTLLDLEMAERAQRRLARHRIESDLPLDKSLENFDFVQLPMLSKARVEALAEGDVWIEKGHILLLFGPPGRDR